ncbi:MAG TPA: hypothetical protein VF867_00115 [Arthrobacter sp.]
MNYKKIQTRVRASGTPASASGEPSVLELGWVDGTHLDEDIQRERERFATVGRTAKLWPSAGEAAIQAVEVAHLSVVAIYEDGSVCVLTYHPEGTA